MSDKREQYQNALSEYGAQVAAGEIRSVEAQAIILRRLLIENGGIPSSLRMPLARVINGTEIPGSAADVVAFAEQILFER